MKLLIDNLDDRREIHRLLERIQPAKRLQYLRWACTKATGAKLRPGIQPGHSGTAIEVYMDTIGLIGQYGLDEKLAVTSLEQFVRRESR